MTKTFTCIVCPNGCEISAETAADGLRITGEGDARIYSIVKHLVRGSDKP